MPFIPLALSVNKSHSTLTRLATGLSLWYLMSAKCSLNSFRGYCLAIKMLFNIHRAFRSLDLDWDSDEIACFIFILVARSGFWFMGIVGRSLAPTSLSRMFLFCLYAITGGWLKIWPPPYIPAEYCFNIFYLNYSTYKDCRRMVQEI